MLNLAIAEAKAGIAKAKSKSTFDVVLSVMQAARDGMCDDPDTQFRGAVGALLEHYGMQSKEATAILKEVEVLKFLSAAAAGVPVDFSRLPHIEKDEKGLGIGVIWRALLHGEDIEKVRRTVEGTPEPPPMPDGWAANVADAWAKFSALKAEHEKSLTAKADAEFKRDWLQSAFSRLQINMLVPALGDGLALSQECDAGVDRLMELLRSIDAEAKTAKPLAEEEAACIGAALDQSVVPDALRRMLATVVCETMTGVRRALAIGNAPVR